MAQRSPGLIRVLFHECNEVADFSAERQDTAPGIVQVMGEGSEGTLPVIRAMVGKGIGSKERVAAWSGQGIAVAINVQLMASDFVFLPDVERMLVREAHGEVEEAGMCGSLHEDRKLFMEG
jgi:hypothetical protein